MQADNLRLIGPNDPRRKEATAVAQFFAGLVDARYDLWAPRPDPPEGAVDNPNQPKR